MRVAPGQTAGAVGGVKDARPGAGGGRSDGRQPGSLREAAGGGLLWARRVGGGPSRRRSGRWRSRWCGACRVLGQPRFHSALPCPFAGRLGRRLGAANCGAGSWASAGYGARADRCLAAEPGGWTVNHKRAGAHLAAGGARGAVSATEARPSAAGRRVPDPAVPCLPQFTSGPTGLVGGPNPQSGGPCGCRPWQGETHPATLPAAGVARRVPGPTSVLSSLTELFVAHGPPAHPGGQWPRVHQPGRAGLA